MKAPLKGAMKIVDGYDTNFVLYCSFVNTAPGNVSGYYRKFEGVKNFKVEAKNGQRF